MATIDDSELVMGLIQLHSKIQKRVGGSLSIHGIGLTEYLVLGQLHAAPDHKMRRIDLAAQVGLSPSGITRLLNPMQKIGLVRKQSNPRDARVSLVVLSAAGKRVFQEAEVAFRHAASALLEPLGRDGHGALAECLESLGALQSG